MRNNGWIFSFVFVVAMIVVGCEKESSTPAPSTPSTPATPAAPGDATTPAVPATPASPSASETPATPAIPAAPADAAAGATDATAAAAKEAAEGAAANSAVATTEAQKLLDQALGYIKENKLDLAEKAIVQLEGMKASLPAAMQTKVADARKLLDTTKAAAGAIKAPALPGASQ